MEQNTEPKEAANKSSSVTSSGDKADYAHGTRLVALTASLMLGMFLTALDNVRLSNHRMSSLRLIILLLDHHWHCDPQDQ
jgi:hypothetical protein